MNRVASSLISAALAVGLVACGSDGASPGAGNSGIRGVVLLGPQCPVVTEDEPCPDAPTEAEIVVREGTVEADAKGAVGGGEVVATTPTDESGHFEVAVSPGRYVVVATSANAMSCDSVTTEVTSGSYSEVTVMCDTGIRAPVEGPPEST